MYLSLFKKTIGILLLLFVLIVSVRFYKAYKAESALARVAQAMETLIQKKETLSSEEISAMRCSWYTCSFLLVQKDPFGQAGPFLTVGIALDDRVPFPTFSGAQARALAQKVGHNSRVYYLTQQGTWGMHDTGRFATIFVPLFP